MSNLVFVLLSLLLGWAALWPARRSFDAVAFHCLALPLGLLAWVAPVLLFGALHRPWWLPGMLAAALVAAGAMAAAFRFAAGASADPAPQPPLWTYPVAALAAGAVAAWQVFLGFSIVGFDAYGHWQASGIWLSEVGVVEQWLMAARAVLVPSWQAAVVTLGSTWGGAIYPVLAVTLLVLLGRLLWLAAPPRLPLRVRVAASVAVPALFALTFPFRYHAFLVHTHAAAALYLLGSVACLMLATRPSAEEGGHQRALTLASGLLAGGFALTRPDTPAYLIVPAAVFAALWLTDRIRVGQRWFWGGVLVPLWCVYGFAFATLGLWVSPLKLHGSVALALMLALTAGPLVLWAVRRIPALPRFASRPVDVMRLAAVVEAVALLVVLYAVREKFAAAIGTMTANLFFGGVQGFVWYFAAGVVLIALLFPAVRRSVPFGDEVLFALFQFAVAALAVHATSHPGRVALNDSFNRVSFHALPFVFWYAGLLELTALDAVRARSLAGDDEPNAAVGLRRQGAAALVVLTVLAGTLVHTARSRVSFTPTSRQRADSFDDIVLGMSGGGQISFEAGIGLRQETGAELRDVRVPNRRYVVRKMAYDRDVLSAQILRLLLRGRVTVADYDPRMRDDDLAAVLKNAPVRTMGRWPVHIVGPKSERYVLRTDSRLQDAYLIPADLDATLRPYAGAPLPASEPQRGIGEDIP